MVMVHGVAESDTTERLNLTELTMVMGIEQARSLPQLSHSLSQSSWRWGCGIRTS